MPKAPDVAAETKEVTPEPVANTEKAAEVPAPKKVEETPKKAQIKAASDDTNKTAAKKPDLADDTEHFKAVCKICGARMKSNAALGGHTSKAHPNESTTFQRKMQRREERALDREMLAAAKGVFSKLNPDKDISSSRSRIAFYKSKIRQNLSEETPTAIKAAQ